MVYPGRFVFPSPLGDPKKNLFFMCELRKSHRTEEVKQLAAKAMKLVEDLAEDALSYTTEVRDSHVHGAAKYCQLGATVWDKVLEGTLSGTDLSDVPALLIVDLFPRPGDLLQAFCASWFSVHYKLVLSGCLWGSGRAELHPELSDRLAG